MVLGTIQFMEPRMDWIRMAPAGGAVYGAHIGPGKGRHKCPFGRTPSAEGIRGAGRAWLVKHGRYSTGSAVGPHALRTVKIWCVYAVKLDMDHIGLDSSG